VVHGSDSPENGKREIGKMFAKATSESLNLVSALCLFA